MTRALRDGFQLACLWLVVVASARAQESVRVKSSVNPTDVYVGQKTTITVKVLTSTFFTQQPEIRIPKLASVVMLSDPISKGPISEEIGDDSYSGVSFEFVAFPLRYGDLDIPPFQITTYQRQDDGKTLESHPVMTPLQLHVTLPDAAIDLTSLICTSQFGIEDQWEPPLKPGTKVRVGDAFTRTVTMRAPDLLGMILPPLPDFDQAGLRAYPKPPVVKDEMNRGDLAATRIETITFQCEKPGYYELPRVEIPWWDVKNKQLKRAVLPSAKFEVEPNPEDEVASPPHSKQTNVRALWFVSVAALLAVLFFCWLLRKRFSLFDKQSELRLFLAVEKACKSSSAKETYTAIGRWIKAVDPGSPNINLLDRFTDEEPGLRRAILQLEQVVAGIERDWAGDDLLRGLRAWRHRQKRTSQIAGLPSLNPTDEALEMSPMR